MPPAGNGGRRKESDYTPPAARRRDVNFLPSQRGVVDLAGHALALELVLRDAGILQVAEQAHATRYGRPRARTEEIMMNIAQTSCAPSRPMVGVLSLARLALEACAAVLAAHALALRAAEAAALSRRRVIALRGWYCGRGPFA